MPTPDFRIQLDVGTAHVTIQSHPVANSGVCVEARAGDSASDTEITGVFRCNKGPDECMMLFVQLVQSLALTE